MIFIVFKIHIYILLSIVLTHCYVLLSQDVQKKVQAIHKQTTAPHMLSRIGYDFLEKKLMEEKQKKRLEEATPSKSTSIVIDPPSPII